MVSCAARGMVCACQDLPTTMGFKRPVCADGPECLWGGVHVIARIHVLVSLRVGLWVYDHAREQICVVCDGEIIDESVSISMAVIVLCVWGMCVGCGLFQGVSPRL